MQESPKDDWESQLTDYTFGVMDGQDAAQFEQQLLECREHVALAQEYSGVAAWLALAVPPAEPPDGHKTRLMSRITSAPQVLSPATANIAAPARPTLVSSQPDIPQAQERIDAGTERMAKGMPEGMPEGMADIGAYREKRRGATFFPALAALAAVFVLFAGLWGWQAIQDAQYRLNIPGRFIAVPVQPQGQATANAVLFVDPQTNEASLLANGLTLLSADQVYELWLLPTASDQKPVPAGVFSAQSDGQARHQITAPSRMKDYVGVAVTVEKAPGVGETQQQPILVGKYSTP